MKKPKTMTDPAGQEIPVRYVPAIDRRRDKLVRGLHREARDLEARLASFRVKVLTQMDGFVKDCATQYQVELGGSKDGVVLSSFDGKLRIDRRNAETVVFDERLKLAQQLITEWIQEKTVSVDADFHKVVQDAFYNRGAGLRTARILALTRLDISGEKWGKAMKLIRESVQIAATRTHARFYERPHRDAEFCRISLDIASASEGRPA